MIRIYGLKEPLTHIKTKLSEQIHLAMVAALDFPEHQRVHLFFPLEEDDFFLPGGRSSAYTLIEISIMKGRSEGAKKNLIHLLFKNAQSIGIAPIDLEVVLSEQPACNWGFRGITGDEAKLSYKIEL